MDICFVFHGWGRATCYKNYGGVSNFELAGSPVKQKNNASIFGVASKLLNPFYDFSSESVGLSVPRASTRVFNPYLIIPAISRER